MNGVALRADRWQALWKSKEYRNYFAPIAVHLTDAQGNSPLKPEGSENVKALIEQAAELIPAAVRSIDRFFKQPRPSFEGVYRPRLVRHQFESYAASAAGESWFCRTAAGVWNPCRSMSQVVL